VSISSFSFSFFLFLFPFDPTSVHSVGIVRQTKESSGALSLLKSYMFLLTRRRRQATGEVRPARIMTRVQMKDNSKQSESKKRREEKRR